MTTPNPAEQNPQAAQPQPEPAQQPKKGFPRWILTIVGIAVVAGGVYAYNYFSSDAAQAKAGDCASITGPDNNPEFKVVDCGDAAANYKIVQVLDNTSGECGPDADSTYTETSRRGPDSKLCLAAIAGK